MKSICITGAYQLDLARVAEILHGAGVSPAKAAKREESINMSMWHEQAIAMAADESSDLQAITNPGRLWEQLAGEIFIANIKSKVWEWADTRSTWLLDYWNSFEPRLNFILVCVSPQQMLANAMALDGPSVSVGAVMNAWQQHHQELLRFHHRNPQRSVLVDALECFEKPQAMVAYCAAKWKLPMAYQASAQVAYQGPDALALYLAQQICQDYPQAASLQHELSATLARLDDISRGAPKDADQNLRSPEAIFASYRALQDRSAETLQVQSALAARDALAQEKAELTTKLGVETQAGKDTKKHLEASIQQLTLLGNQLDEQKKLAKAAQLKIEQLPKSVPAVENKAQADALKTAQRKCKEAEQEGELLLLQLHQVQEELENYFLQHQEAQKQLQAEKTRWQRMLNRTPDYCDFESIQLVSMQGVNGLETHWKLKGLDAGGRNLPELEFQTIVEQGSAGFWFTRQAGSAGPLIRWPIPAANQTQVLVIPVSTPETAKERIEILRDLALSDLQLLQTLARLLIRTLEKPDVLKAPASFNPADLTVALIQFITLIDRYATASLCYDRVALKREQVNPDYEHLWLALENTSFQGKHWPSFEFRLACANVRPNLFGAHPKLEFPEESGKAQFDGWFAEAHDDFGAKFELRFAMPQSMDVSVWQRLSENDRKLIINLFGRLPSILGALDASGAHLRRPAKEWTNMVREMKRILAQRVAPPKAIGPTGSVAAPVQAPAPANVGTKKAVAKATRTTSVAKKPK